MPMSPTANHPWLSMWRSRRTSALPRLSRLGFQATDAHQLSELPDFCTNVVLIVEEKSFNPMAGILAPTRWPDTSGNSALQPSTSMSGSIAPEHRNNPCKAVDKDAKPCAAFNSGAAHNAFQLKADGSCRFGHVCDHWVSDKGPGGKCLGSAGTKGHARDACDNPGRCDSKLE